MVNILISQEKSWKAVHLCSGHLISVSSPQKSYKTQFLREGFLLKMMIWAKMPSYNWTLRACIGDEFLLIAQRYCMEKVVWERLVWDAVPSIERLILSSSLKIQLHRDRFTSQSMCPLPQCSVCSAYYELPQSFNLLQIKIARIFLTGAERDTASSSQCSKLNLNSKYILKIWTIALQLKLSSVGESEKSFGQVTNTGGRILFFCHAYGSFHHLAYYNRPALSNWGPFSFSHQVSDMDFFTSENLFEIDE